MASLLHSLRNLRPEFKVMLATISIYNWARSLTLQYDQLYAAALGADPTQLGFLNGIGVLATSIIIVFIGWYADKYGAKKVVLLGLILSAVASGICSLAVAWWILIPAFITMNISMSTILPFTDVIFIGTTDSNKRGKAIGFARAFWAIISSSAPAVAALIVAVFGGINAQGIRPLYIIRLFLDVSVLLLITKFLRVNFSPQQKNESKSKTGGFLKDFRELFRGEKGLGRWMLIWVIRYFLRMLVLPFIPLWIVNVKGADPNVLGVMGSLGIMTWAILMMPAGMVVDKIGRKKSFILFELILYIGTLWLIFAPTPEHIIVVGLLGAYGLTLGTEGSGIGGLSFLPMMLMSWEMVPAEKRGRWHGVLNIFSCLGFLSTLLGGLMWQQGFMTEVLLIPILLEVLLVIPLLLTVPARL